MENKHQKAGYKVVRIRRREPQIDQTAHAPIRIYILYTNPNTISALFFFSASFNSIDLYLSLRLKIQILWRKNQSVASKWNASHSIVQRLKRIAERKWERDRILERGGSREREREREGRKDAREEANLLPEENSDVAAVKFGEVCGGTKY